ncbi:hypothetical protein [uncultured Mediterranean phage uvMED]|nr:hypothetical protein [uncultured Mediterranean phage uvMED]
MATLSGTAISDTYPLLLKIESGGLDGTLRVVEDGDATASALFLATDSALISGNGTKLYFYDADGGEHISADSSANLTIAAGVDINLTAGTDINLTAGTDVNIPANVGLTFGHASNQKIEGNGTDLAIDATGNINITSTANETDSIKIEENSGTDGTIKIYANTGSGADSINLLSDVGGITLSAGNTSEGVKVGTVSGAPITIGHTTSETTVADNLTVTGNTTLSGNLTATTVNGQSFTNTLGGTGGVVRTFSPVSYTSSKGLLAGGSDYTSDTLNSTIVGTIHTSSHSASSDGPSIAITAPSQGMDVYLVTVTSTRKDVSSGSAATLFSHQGGAYIVTITSEANNRMTISTLGEDDLDGTLSTSSGNHFVTFTLATAAGGTGFSGAMRLNALLLMRGSM